VCLLRLLNNVHSWRVYLVIHCWDCFDMQWMEGGLCTHYQGKKWLIALKLLKKNISGVLGWFMLAHIYSLTHFHTDELIKKFSVMDLTHCRGTPLTASPSEALSGLGHAEWGSRIQRSTPRYLERHPCWPNLADQPYSRSWNWSLTDDSINTISIDDPKRALIGGVVVSASASQKPSGRWFKFRWLRMIQ
jgi:hypothetical protein